MELGGFTIFLASCAEPNITLSVVTFYNRMAKSAVVYAMNLSGTELKAYGCKLCHGHGQKIIKGFKAHVGYDRRRCRNRRCKWAQFSDAGFSYYKHLDSGMYLKVLEIKVQVLNSSLLLHVISRSYCYTV